MSRRVTVCALALATAVAGCEDLGLDGNTYLEDAMDRPPSELVAAVYRPQEVQSQILIMDGREWVPSGGPLTLSEEELRPVGSSNGQTVYARSWDQPPFDLLFTRLTGGPAPADSAVFGPQEGVQWQEWAGVWGQTAPGTGATEGGGAGSHGAQPDPPGAAAGH